MYAASLVVAAARASWTSSSRARKKSTKSSTSAKRCDGNCRSLKVDNHPLRKLPFPRLSIVPSAPEQPLADQDRDDGMYRGARDYPLSAYAYLDYAKVEDNAHNASNYDAAEALDMN